MREVSIKEEIINKLSKELNLEKEVIETVISEQGTGVLKALKEYNEVELSGFGKFIISPRKLRNGIKRYTKIVSRLEPKEGIVNISRKLDGSREALQKLKRRSDEIGTK